VNENPLIAGNPNHGAKLLAGTVALLTRAGVALGGDLHVIEQSHPEP
jgi:hypothetical protein